VFSPVALFNLYLFPETVFQTHSVLFGAKKCGDAEASNLHVKYIREAFQFQNANSFFLLFFSAEVLHVCSFAIRK